MKKVESLDTQKDEKTNTKKSIFYLYREIF
jgi:hypothetical protein